MSDYTPTTSTVRDAYTRALRNAFIASKGEHNAEFDRWLNEVKSQAWDEGFEAGERDVFEHEKHNYENPCIENPYKEEA